MVRNARRDRVIIPPNGTVSIAGMLGHELIYQPVCALLQATAGSGIPEDLDITPTVMDRKRQGIQCNHADGDYTARRNTLRVRASASRKLYRKRQWKYAPLVTCVGST